MVLLRFLHFVGAASFFGAVLSAAIVNRVAVASSDAKSADTAAFQLLRVANIGLVLLLATGVGIVAMTGPALFKLPWMHVMLTCFLAAGAVTGIAQGKARKLSEGGNASLRNSIGTLCIVSIVVSLVAIAAGVFRF